jgi:hypothetical protein
MRNKGRKREGWRSERKRGMKRKAGRGGGSKKVKSKSVPLHAMEAPGGRGGMAPTHSYLGTRWG